MIANRADEMLPLDLHETGLHVGKETSRNERDEKVGGRLIARPHQVHQFCTLGGGILEEFGDVGSSGQLATHGLEQAGGDVDPLKSCLQGGDHGLSGGALLQQHPGQLGGLMMLGDADELTDEEKKRQLRLASEATKLQQTLLNEFIQLPPQERNRQLERARQCSDNFLKQVSTLPPGPERIVFLQSIDPETSRLLALHKLWLSHSHNQDRTTTANKK